MNRTHVDFAMIGAGWVLAAVAVWLSASGCDQVALVIYSVVFSLVVAWVGAGVVDRRRQHSRRTVLFAGFSSFVCLGLIASVADWQWPLRASYASSRTVFDSLGQRVRAGEAIEMPQRVGTFTIRKAEVSNRGVVCLWVVPGGNGNLGFVRCGPDRIPFNLWSSVNLDNHWQFICED